VGDKINPDNVKIVGVPAFLWSHGMDPRIGKVPIGQPLWIRAGDFKGHRALLAKSKFDADEFSRGLFEKIKSGSLRYFSIGFVPLEWDYFRDQQGGRDIKKSEIIEYSLCSTPCNPYAQVLGSDKAFSAICYKMASSGPSDGKRFVLDGISATEGTVRATIEGILSKIIHEELRKALRQ
jgi:hypothetical protein